MTLRGPSSPVILIQHLLPYYRHLVYAFCLPSSHALLEAPVCRWQCPRLGGAASLVPPPAPHTLDTPTSRRTEWRCHRSGLWFWRARALCPYAESLGLWSLHVR
eukprot:scaffold262236_cov31-Tisochrysis_lutea.AAC.3